MATDPQIQRSCGAACLSAVYKSLGKEIPSSAIWPLIAKPNRFGTLSSTTHLMTKHALAQGFSAVAIQARHPLHLLTVCRDRGIAAILNHRLEADSATGHYSVLADIDDTQVVLRDAAFGSMRRIPHADLLRLWQPLGQPSEILGSVLIGISAAAADAPLPCEFCHTQLPAETACPKCNQAVALRPAALLGCLRDGCIARAWNYVCCPSCDYVWSFSQAQAASSEAQASSPDAARSAAADTPAPPPVADLSVVFAALDKFTALIASVPGAAGHADLKAQLGVIESARERLKLAQIEDLAQFKAQMDWLAALRAKSAQDLAAHRKQVEEREAPPPRLDGDALGQALLKNLGLK